jgi:hypothetical protein
MSIEPNNPDASQLAGPQDQDRDIDASTVIAPHPAVAPPVEPLAVDAIEAARRTALKGINLGGAGRLEA